jgi:2-oxopent-4-enoate/cis-2-oxohex-4-enoate hydratase
VFNDKHLSYRWDWAKEMYDTASELGIPFKAGEVILSGSQSSLIPVKPGDVMKCTIGGLGSCEVEFNGEMA